MEKIIKINIIMLYSIITVFYNQSFAQEVFDTVTADNGIKTYNIPENKKLIGFKVSSNFLIEDLYTDDRGENDNLYHSHCLSKVDNINKEYEFNEKICINENKKNINFLVDYEFSNVKDTLLNYKTNRKIKSFSIFPYRQKLKLEYENNKNKEKEMFIYTSLDLETGKTLYSKKFIFSNN
jgi:hypothetical protein